METPRFTFEAIIWSKSLCFYSTFKFSTLKGHNDLIIEIKIKDF